MLISISLMLTCFSISFVWAASSPSETEFTIGEFVDYCEDGITYWDLLGFPHSTSEAGLWCSMGQDPYIPGGPIGACCPDGFDCMGVPGAYKCEIGNICKSDMSQTECELPEVDGYYYDDYCWCNRDDFLCDDYINSADCDADDVDAATGNCEYKSFECDGIEVSTSKCTCVWNSANEECDIGNNIEEKHYGKGAIPNGFECSTSTEAGPCLGGEQELNWTSIVTQVIWPIPPVPVSCLEAANCGNGSMNRTCGEPLIKLHGFSLFSLIAAFLLIIGIYHFNGRFEKL